MEYYVDTTGRAEYPPQLFDLEADPDERCDLGAEPAYALARADPVRSPP